MNQADEIITFFLKLTGLVAIVIWIFQAVSG